MRGRLAAVAGVLLGGFATAMGLIRVVLVPFWSSLPPGEFRAWFRRHGKQVGIVMIPLGAASAVTATAAALLDHERGSATAAAAAVGVVAITVTVNEPANERFWSDEPMSDDDTTALLHTWTRWHDVRVALGVVAAVAAARRLAR